ncbi:type VII secretion target [Amycolatopsis jiangsuensis]|uniref:Excreted virulence factor EspC (Type VII ESX diderm) n=1 Tax=Amycolatopsis jiangsuensis TaxID=1181879 RepID=A0A840J4L4_9PSEU|nr:type VII secretion target [Amycolatopsis jiangsuensis]MBB4688362.1 hypothetical protein [Amycolatopsis jiangsuensis]
MTGEFGVDPGQLRRHAGTVGALADRLSVVSRSGPGELGDQALGTFVQFLTAGLQSAAGRVGEAMTHASSTVDKVSANLASAADHYEERDRQNTISLPREDRR